MHTKSSYYDFFSKLSIYLMENRTGKNIKPIIRFAVKPLPLGIGGYKAHRKRFVTIFLDHPPA
jgi:hypothetical protein